ncbi:hypothetical protein FC093_14135 [Ilyomonas limi]|uniref:Porin n=1 Tax=Ilyomonas limi TaxID=2575867 RepID=A0A4V5UU25_9BACT|nr:hypothetical protein [Ilyomonas limi]TKK67433.1 hypothetical protein FC093_14135 [Ilyomonas limi]
MLYTIKRLIAIAFFFFAFCITAAAQRTDIRGFGDVTTTYQNKKMSFGFDEQDLFITSQLTDRISFLGETVFKPDSSSHSGFDVSIERIIIKYNYAGNNNLLIGKHHTPINYWNDTYHHGRVFFPTIFRPLLFDAGYIPLHTTGISLEGHDLGKLQFGYNLMVGNGLGSQDVLDNDKSKSVTALVYIKPVDRLRIGASYYHDVIQKGAEVHNHPATLNWKVKQHLFTGSVAYFGKKYELLAESTMGLNHTDSTGTTRSFASYVYTGYHITEKLIPYVRIDNLAFQDDEVYFNKDNTTAFLAGIRYQINFLTVVKLEYMHQHSRYNGDINKVTAQFAIGF